MSKFSYTIFANFQCINVYTNKNYVKQFSKCFYSIEKYSIQLMLFSSFKTENLSFYETILQISENFSFICNLKSKYRPNFL